MASDGGKLAGIFHPNDPPEGKIRGHQQGPTLATTIIDKCVFFERRGERVQIGLQSWYRLVARRMSRNFERYIEGGNRANGRGVDAKALIEFVQRPSPA